MESEFSECQSVGVFQSDHCSGFPEAHSYREDEKRCGREGFSAFFLNTVKSVSGSFVKNADTDAEFLHECKAVADRRRYFQCKCISSPVVILFFVMPEYFAFYDRIMIKKEINEINFLP